MENVITIILKLFASFLATITALFVNSIFENKGIVKKYNVRKIWDFLLIMGIVLVGLIIKPSVDIFQLMAIVFFGKLIGGNRFEFWHTLTKGRWWWLEEEERQKMLEKEKDK